METIKPQHGIKTQLCQQNLWRKFILINKNDFLYQIIIISFEYLHYNYLLHTHTHAYIHHSERHSQKKKKKLIDPIKTYNIHIRDIIIHLLSSSNTLFRYSIRHKNKI